MEPLPIPSNMEGQAPRNPYSRLNTMFNPRLIASNLAMGALPGPTGLIDRMTGNNIRNQVDRATGAALARNQQETNAYMRQLMRNDPGYEQYGIGQRLRNWARNLFGGDDNQGATGPAPIPQMNPSRPYAAPSPVFQGNPFGFGSQQFHQFAPSLAPQPLYGTGQGMMRAQPAPLYGTGQGMMRAPTTNGSQGEGGSQGGSSSGGGASSGGGVLSPGGRLLSHGVATRIR